MINEKDRNAVRIIELPACKMVWSGVYKDASNDADSSLLKRYEKWMTAQDALRRDRFYSRDFMWYDIGAGGLAWGLAVVKTPEDTGGYDVIDFPGGLYAVVNYADNDAEGAHKHIQKWIEDSGCFASDDNANRHFMWHFISTEAAKAAMGYYQYDFYFPIRIVEGTK